MADYDVIVVGAGPAGAMAARGCAVGGLKTLILDRAKLPRYKPCGGGVTQKAKNLLGFNVPEELISIANKYMASVRICEQQFPQLVDIFEEWMYPVARGIHKNQWWPSHRYHSRWCTGCDQDNIYA